MKFRDDGCWFALNVGAEQEDSSMAAQQWEFGPLVIQRTECILYNLHSPGEAGQAE